MEALNSASHSKHVIILSSINTNKMTWSRVIMRLKQNHVMVWLIGQAANPQ